ncbi:MAG TPA: Crp/Fnr family transcriptional regulator [Ignavibacteria bacterium]|jgi:CRP/FNR family transcriptional regulator
MVLNLELNEIIKVHDAIESRDFKKNDILFREGDIPVGIYCIESGRIKLLKNETQTNQRIVHLAGKGEILGVHAIVNNHPNTNTAVVIDRAKTLFLNANDFLQLVESDNSYKLLVMKTLCTRIETMEHHINLISDKPSEQRFADTLLMLINKYGLKQKTLLKIKLTLDDLASYTCTSRSYMKRIIMDFSQKGLISYRSGEISVLDRKQLESIAINTKLVNGS